MADEALVEDGVHRLAVVAAAFMQSLYPVAGRHMVAVVHGRLLFGSGDYAGCAASQATTRGAFSGGGKTDRKSGVEGKSVSVRVDFGGRRSIKKKKNQTTN